MDTRHTTIASRPTFFLLELEVRGTRADPHSRRLHELTGRGKRGCGVEETRGGVTLSRPRVQLLHVRLHDGVVAQTFVVCHRRRRGRSKCCRPEITQP